MEAKKDYKTFLYLEGRSRSPQASFLLGLLEYKASMSFWRRRGAGLFGIPHDRKDAIRLILRSLKGNASPFVDDINFFVFDSECGCTGHGDGVREKDFEKYYPVDRLAGLLHAEYPHNGHVNAFIDRLEAHRRQTD